MHATRSRRRSAFTLLEMLLAMAIGFLLLSALYVTISAQFQNAQAGRDLLEDGTIARAVLNRIASDIASNLSAVDPRVLPDPAAADDASTASGGTASASTTPADPSAVQNPMAADTSNSVFFNQGVQGDASRLTLYVSRVPRAIQKGPVVDAALSRAGVESDLRRISYWVVGNGGNAQGLARQEIARVTSSDIDSLPPDVPDAAKLVIASEVTAVSFEYFDGKSWQATWDGAAVTGEDSLPIGPPSAIAINLTVARRAPPGATTPPAPRVYRHVVFLSTGNNFPSQSSP